jgi:Zn-dependent peptidase ImmA (M78 family)
MTMRVDVRPELLRWACDRAGVGVDDLAGTFPKLRAWIGGESKPTFRQLEQFAKSIHAPVGYLFLPEPPVERVPIPDMRTVGNRRVNRPSPDLLDTIYVCQQRQEWYREFARTTSEPVRSFVGSARLTDDIERTAMAIRHALDFDLEERRRFSTWTDALRRFVDQADALGVLVMVSGVVGSNNRRKLDPDEFRGFALTDELAPLVFINGSDTKAAQMFTLAHEIAHLWLGQSALSDVSPITTSSHAAEQWCNQVAAELLVPLSILRSEYDPRADARLEAQRLARRFKVSSLVILRRMHDAGGLTRDELWDEYHKELDHLREVSKGSGGSFYRTQAARVGQRFARALVVSTLEGQTLHRDAFKLLGFSKTRTLHELGSRLGVA